MDVCDVRVKCCHDTEIITLPALSSRCQVWVANMTLEATRGSLCWGGGISIRSEHYSGWPQDPRRVQPNHNSHWLWQMSARQHPTLTQKSSHWSHRGNPHIGPQHLCVFALYIQLDPAPIQPTPVYPLLHCFWSQVSNDTAVSKISKFANLTVVLLLQPIQ